MPFAVVRPAWSVGAGLALGGCVPPLSVLDPAGRYAAQLSELIWTFTIVCAVVWVLVTVALVGSLIRRKRASAEVLGERVDASESRLLAAVGAAIAATAVVLAALNLLSYDTHRALGRYDESALLTIRVTGHQWWWEIVYEDADAQQVLTTANEFHVPTGRPVRVKLLSSDVIHSFWVPQLMGKMDLVPGYENAMVLQADRPGVYQGACAEFCGLQHAHMRLTVIADRPEAYDAWKTAQLSPDRAPADARGRAVFVDRPCAGCHTIVGTPARGRVGPDLTHVGSRATIGAGALRNDRANLAAWILDAPHFKPGTQMPPMRLSPEDLSALLDYLQALR